MYTCKRAFITHIYGLYPLFTKTFGSMILIIFIAVCGRPNPVAKVLLHGDHVSASSLPVRPRKGDHHYA